VLGNSRDIFYEATWVTPNKTCERSGQTISGLMIQTPSGCQGSRV